MICPTCGDEFRDGFDRCPDCDIDLVEPQPGARSEPDHPESAELLLTSDMGFLAVAKSVLADASIPYSVQGEESMVLYGSPSGMPTRLFVPADRLGEASALLESADVAVDGAA